MALFCVVGSINMDLVAGADSLPGGGETVIGNSFGTFPGGKGANQAVALARLGGMPRMVGAVGNDDFGRRYLEVFSGEGVDASFVSRIDEVSTGVAVIWVDASGENRIVVVPGANSRVDSRGVDAALREASAQDAAGPKLALFQLEIPIDVVAKGLVSARQEGWTTILDPAPARALGGEVLQHVDILTPNESETRALVRGLQGSPGGSDGADLETTGRLLTGAGARSVVFKRGAAGAAVFENGELTMVSGYRVTAVDTTAAGDSFNAGLAYSLGYGRSLVEAARYACAVGALACTGFGAQSAMPRASQVDAFLRS